jgi:hypothetical protein
MAVLSNCLTDTTAAATASGRLAQLSLQGLQHAQALAAVSVEVTAARIYAWNRLPSSAWRRLDAEPALIAAKAAGAAGKKWIQIAAGPPWCRWRPMDAPTATHGRLWKLYVSPQPHHLAEAVCISLSECEGLPVVSLKYGVDADGILRPDKLVIHVATQEAVAALAERLMHRLGGCPAHGTPYTAELGGDGLISWGCDPPPGSAAARVAPSWRSWVARQLADGLARQRSPGIEPWQRALEDVARAGVDPLTWAPMPELWAISDRA